MQCQYGKSGRCSHGHLPCVLCPGLAVSSLAPWPIWLSCCEGRSPVGSQIALHCLGPQPSWESCNLSWTSRWGRLRQGRWGSPSVGPAWVMPWVRKALLSSQPHPWGETLAGGTGSGLLLQEPRAAAPGIGGALEVRPGDLGAVVPRAKLTVEWSSGQHREQGPWWAWSWSEWFLPCLLGWGPVVFTCRPGMWIPGSPNLGYDY